MGCIEENVDEYDTLRIRWFVLCVLDFTFLRERSERTE